MGRGLAGHHGPHYAVLRFFVGTVARTALRVARVRVTVHGSEHAEAALADGRPLVVLSIHSGEGDSLLVLDHLLRRHRRRPRIVMHEALAVDPLIDVIGRRLPNRFVDPRGGDTEVEIAAMSRDLGGGDAVLIFPEGGKLSDRAAAAGDRPSPASRTPRGGRVGARRCGRLSRRRGRAARWPRLEAAPDGRRSLFLRPPRLPDTMGQAWRELPHPTPIDVELWLVRADELPEGADARIDWLFGWWKTLDAWVGEKSSRER